MMCVHYKLINDTLEDLCIGSRIVNICAPQQILYIRLYYHIFGWGETGEMFIGHRRSIVYKLICGMGHIH